jgi:hypothetical protein
MRLEEHEAQAEHAGPPLPAVNQRAAFRPLDGEIAQDGEAVGVLAGGLHRQLIRVGIPGGGRMDDRRVHTRLGHLPEHVVLGVDRHLAVVRIGRLAAAPDVDLRVDDDYGASLL